VPIALAFSPLGRALYVADGKAGTVTVVDPESLQIRTRIEAKPGLGPLRFSEDGRWGVVVNPADHHVYVIDASTDRLVHRIPVGTQPYQVSFTRLYAYIRSLGSEQVGLIPLSELDKPELPQVKYFPAGQGAPGAAADISIANSMVRSVKEAASYVVNQAEGTVYYYMEGMIAPMGSYTTYGRVPRAVGVVDRSVRETEKGVYAAKFRVPAGGDYNVARDDLDVRNVERWAPSVLCAPAVRSAMEKLIEWGLVDVFREQHPEGGIYSWWDYRMLGFPKNDGLRIDYLLATPPVADRCREAFVDRDERKGQKPSDHAPVVAVFDVG